jgi:murein DD-endopeptidase MepM/ murein hydrolase activator NlpD
VDILMPIGTPILAMRDGVVVRVEESFVDGDNVPTHENYVFVELEDGASSCGLLPGVDYTAEP